MKRIEDIEKLGPEEFERIISDSSVKVPENLGRRIEDALTAAQTVKSTHRSPSWKLAIAPAAAAIAAALIVGVNYQNANRMPADTFDDLAVAYAELERTLGYISSKIGTGRELTDAALSQTGKASQIIEKINKK